MPSGRICVVAAAVAAVCCTACSGPHPGADTAVAAASKAGGDSLLPLARPGRTLHFRGRSLLDVSRPDQEPAPQVGYIFSRMRFLPRPEAEGWNVLEENDLYSAAGATLSDLSEPRERRHHTLRVDGASFEVTLIEQTTAPRTGPDRFGKALPVRFTHDGFGLNAGARRQAGLVGVAVPRAWFAELDAGRSLELSVDFYLVPVDPLADRHVVPATGAGPPAAAETQVTGRTLLEPLGREPYVVNWRHAPPPAPSDPAQAAPRGQADTRVELPALRVRVQSQLSIRRLSGDVTTHGRMQRHDNLTWTVLDDPEEPWILAWDGRVESETGQPPAVVLRDAFVSRSLYRIDAGSLDASPPPP